MAYSGTITWIIQVKIFQNWCKTSKQGNKKVYGHILVNLLKFKQWKLFKCPEKNNIVLEKAPIVQAVKFSKETMEKYRK